MRPLYTLRRPLALTPELLPCPRRREPLLPCWSPLPPLTSAPVRAAAPPSGALPLFDDAPAPGPGLASIVSPSARRLTLRASAADALRRRLDDTRTDSFCGRPRPRSRLSRASRFSVRRRRDRDRRSRRASAARRPRRLRRDRGGRGALVGRAHAERRRGRGRDLDRGPALDARAAAATARRGGEHAVRTALPTCSRTRTILRPTSDGSECGADELEALSKPAVDIAPPGDVTAAAVRRVCRVAIDCDYEFFNGKFGGNATAGANYVLTLMALVSLIYERDLDTAIEVSYLNLWSTPSDPTRRRRRRGSCPNSATTGTRTVAACRASSRTCSPGATWAAASRTSTCCCNPGSAYAVSQLDAVYEYPSASSTWDAMVTAHEMGHNFRSVTRTAATGRIRGSCPPPR